MSALATVVVLLATSPRWLRVAQREHYLPRRTTAISSMWYRLVPVSLGAALVVAAAAVGTDVWADGALRAVLGVVLTVAAGLLPVGLAWRGVERPLVWTDRVKRLLAVLVVVVLLVGLAVWGLDGLGWGTTAAAVAVLAVPLWVDVALALAQPLEAALAQKFVKSARTRLGRVKPQIVGITGSYGKTTTKNTLRHLLGGGPRTVYATPGSFNNLLGLARAVNEGLPTGTDIFIAEMGTYGPGEIAALVDVFPVDVACITAIGDVHLERMKTRDNIARAKSEITVKARSTVLCVDYPELDALASTGAGHVVRVSGSDAGEQVAVVQGSTPHTWLVVHGDQQVEVDAPASGIPMQVAACALALALELGDDFHRVAPRLSTVPATSHRAEATTEPGRPTVIDDTFNSNLDGATHALQRAVTLAQEQGGTAWVVTPGMVELGSKQAEQNAEFAKRVIAAGAQLRIVGRTNRRALLQGSDHQGVCFLSRREASADVFAQAGVGDVILFENDLPDHYA